MISILVRMVKKLYGQEIAAYYKLSHLKDHFTHIQAYIDVNAY